MPKSAYFQGHGDEVMANMTKQYGAEKGERVFYATAQKRGMAPPKRKTKKAPAHMAFLRGAGLK